MCWFLALRKGNHHGRPKSIKNKLVPVLFSFSFFLQVMNSLCSMCDVFFNLISALGSWLVANVLFSFSFFLQVMNFSCIMPNMLFNSISALGSWLGSILLTPANRQSQFHLPRAFQPDPDPLVATIKRLAEMVEHISKVLKAMREDLAFFMASRNDARERPLFESEIRATARPRYG